MVSLYDENLVYDVVKNLCLGFTPFDVSELLGVADYVVQDIMQKPVYFQILKLIGLEKKEEVKELTFEDLKFDALQVLKTIVKSDKATFSTQLAASKTILEGLGLGKRPPKMKPDTGKFDKTDIEKFKTLAGKQKKIKALYEVKKQNG